MTQFWIFILNTASLSLITLLDFSPRRLNHPRFNYFNVFGGPSGHLGRQKPSRTQPWHLAGEQNKRGKEQLLFSPERHSGKEVCLHPCKSHQRVFEQIDSRWTPLSTINQQLSLCLYLSLPPFLSLSFSLIVPYMNYCLSSKWNKYNNYEPIFKLILFAFPGVILEYFK